MRVSDEVLTDELRRIVPQATTAYLFGSHATGQEHAESDFDLAVLAPAPLPPVQRWHLQEDLAARLNHPVDLVDLRTASTVLAVQIIGQGRLLFDDNSNARALFEMITLAEYADLNERRQGLLDDIRARGTVYG